MSILVLVSNFCLCMLCISLYLTQYITNTLIVAEQPFTNTPLCGTFFLCFPHQYQYSVLMQWCGALRLIVETAQQVYWLHTPIHWLFSCRQTNYTSIVQEYHNLLICLINIIKIKLKNLEKLLKNLKHLFVSCLSKN